ncbi:MAG: hypothetical protein OEZ68_01025 [Gammaproteobacteria bacterium]|nr:hypothetical protein [Gammaproteobacteria bacterium]MDH5799361.1 hypothetical protein [Gammaproteobacteria bacterium]
MASKPQTIEQRTGNERRAGNCGHPYPYVDTHGFLVTEDRRKTIRRDPQSRSTKKSQPAPSR